MALAAGGKRDCRGGAWARRRDKYVRAPVSEDPAWRARSYAATSGFLPMPSWPAAPTIAQVQDNTAEQRACSTNRFLLACARPGLCRQPDGGSWCGQPTSAGGRVSWLTPRAYGHPQAVDRCAGCGSARHHCRRVRVTGGCGQDLLEVGMQTPRMLNTVRTAAPVLTDRPARRREHPQPGAPPRAAGRHRAGAAARPTGDDARRDRGADLNTPRTWPASSRRSPTRYCASRLPAAQVWGAGAVDQRIRRTPPRKGYPSGLGSARGCGTSLRIHVEALTGPASVPRLGAK
jgi:hypothetical protein